MSLVSWAVALPATDRTEQRTGSSAELPSLPPKAKGGRQWNSGTTEGR